ncbi:MAG: hypothetical protein KGD60_14755 [Candidatus Thorarchaeota archaeon]|nr:hypothetical protein [Candidatus Thorarchaeota archaeon]
MYPNELRSGLEIPPGVKPEDIMKALELGHGYRWTVLTRRPLLVAHGNPTLGNMPELLMTGTRSIVVAGGDPAYVDRLRQVLDMLQRHTERLVVKQERVKHG